MGRDDFPFLLIVKFGFRFISFLVLLFYHEHIKMRVKSPPWEERGHYGAASCSIVSRSCTCFLGHGFGRSLIAGNLSASVPLLALWDTDKPFDTCVLAFAKS